MYDNVYMLWFAIECYVKNALLIILHHPENKGLPTDGQKLYQHLETRLDKLSPLKKRGVLKQYQWELLFPANGQTSTAEWDITLIVMMIRNFIDIPPPEGGWNGLPSTHDTSIAACVLRARLMRNLVHHLGHFKIGDNEFERHWTSIEELLTRLSYNKINEFKELLTIRKGIRNAGLDESLENKINFPKIIPNYEDGCNDFIRMYKNNRKEFKNIDGLGYFYNEEIQVGTGRSSEIFLGLAVCLGKDGVGKWVSIKRCLLSNERDEKVKERNVLRRINAETCLKGHKNILDLIYSTSDEKFYYIITPLYNYTLEEYLLNREVPFEKKVKICKQLLATVEYLHSSQIQVLHRNLQPNNIMIQLLEGKTDGKIMIKLIGFGDSSQYNTKLSRSDASESKWLPPIIFSDVIKSFTNIHECFVLMMLLVYILSGGKHPFVNFEDDVDNQEELRKDYSEKKHIKLRDNILNHNDLQEFFDGKFDEFFIYFNLVEKDDLNRSSSISAKLTAKRIIETLRNLHTFQSLNHTPGYRVLALLPFSGERIMSNYLRKSCCEKLFSKKPDISKLIQSVRQNSTILQNCFVEHCNFKKIPTEEDMPYERFIEELRNINPLCYDIKKPIFLFVYIVAHACYDTAAEDDRFDLTAEGENNYYIKDLLNDINSCFKNKNLKVCLFFEGCRKEIESSKQNKDYPSNAVVFNAVKKGQTAKYYSDVSKFSTPWQFCYTLAKYIKPGKSLKYIFEKTTEYLSNTYIFTAADGKVTIKHRQYEINQETPENCTKVFLTPELSTKNDELMEFIF